MLPIPVIITAAVVAAVPPLRNRVVPVAKATLEGSLGVVGAGLGAAVGVIDAALNGSAPSEATAED